MGSIISQGLNNSLALLNTFPLGIDEEEVAVEESTSTVSEEIPPLEGEEDASRMEEVD